ncbi:luciferin 4-monooxygenase-like [Choristoneura fumiferana]|uniref:luciferin 4-monooxygenase-like n=1 Tax=Choristoneura fumiferana TaxID=7141 RepID=UPI003D15BBBE
MKIVTFGDGDHSFAKFMKKYDDCTPDNQFRVATFDTNKIYAWLISTSGTTGLPKVAAFKHRDIIKVLHLYSLLKEKVIKPALTLSSVQWISSYLASLSMITANHIKVQTSSPVTIDHAIDIINKYKPVVSTGSPALFAGIIKHPKHCDLTCFNKVVMYGFATNEMTLNLVKSRMQKDAVVWNLFGQTECIGPIFLPAPNGPFGNIGTSVELIKTQLVDPKTGEVITKPNQIGELWTKGPRLVEYYNNPEATAKAFSADGWYKTGDLLYMDENGYHYFVERMSSAFRYKNYYVMPMEIELVIRDHPGVLDVCVLGVPHPDDGKRAIACVMRTPGSRVTEQEIKDLVAEKLSIYKHLHGGVLFVNDFPRTVTGKIATAKLEELILTQKIEEHDFPNTGNVKKLINTFQQLSNHDVSTNISKGRH